MQNGPQLYEYQVKIRTKCFPTIGIPIKTHAKWLPTMRNPCKNACKVPPSYRKPCKKHLQTEPQQCEFHVKIQAKCFPARGIPVKIHAKCGQDSEMGARMRKSSPEGARSRQIAEIDDLSASGRRVPRGAPEWGNPSPRAPESVIKNK